MSSPIKPTIKTEIIPIILIIASIALSFYFYANWPNVIASHWNFQGEVDGYSSKTFNAVFFPILMAAMYLLFLFLPYLDPKKERYQEFAPTYHLFKTLLLLVLFALYLIVGFFNLGFKINVGYWVAGLIGLMIIIIGTQLKKFKSNWFIGIRTPWTLSSEKVWDKTHRVGGWLFIIFGLLIVATPFLPPLWAAITFFGGAALAVIGTIVYSYWEFRKEKK